MPENISKSSSDRNVTMSTESLLDMVQHHGLLFTPSWILPKLPKGLSDSIFLQFDIPPSLCQCLCSGSGRLQYQYSTLHKHTHVSSPPDLSDTATPYNIKIHITDLQFFLTIFLSSSSTSETHRIPPFSPPKETSTNLFLISRQDSYLSNANTV